MAERNSGMADNTDPKLKNQVIYSVYVRNQRAHSGRLQVISNVSVRLERISYG